MGHIAHDGRMATLPAAQEDLRLRTLADSIGALAEGERRLRSKAYRFTCASTVAHRPIFTQCRHMRYDLQQFPAMVARRYEWSGCVWDNGQPKRTLGRMAKSISIHLVFVMISPAIRSNVFPSGCRSIKFCAPPYPPSSGIVRSKPWSCVIPTILTRRCGVLVVSVTR